MKIAKLCEAHKDVQAYKEPFEVVRVGSSCIICGRDKWHKRYSSMSPEVRSEYCRQKRLKHKLRIQKRKEQHNHPLDIEQPEYTIETEVVKDEKDERQKTLKELKKELVRVRNLRIRLQNENRLINFEKKEKNRIAARMRQEKEAEELSDNYVKQKFIQGHGGKANLIAKDVPQDVVDAYRDLMQFKRILKKQKES